MVLYSFALNPSKKGAKPFFCFPCILHRLDLRGEKIGLEAPPPLGLPFLLDEGPVPSETGMIRNRKESVFPRIP